MIDKEGGQRKSLVVVFHKNGKFLLHYLYFKHVSAKPAYNENNQNKAAGLSREVRERRPPAKFAIW